jgi:hypothetical protein
MDEKGYSSGFRGIPTLRSRQLLPGGGWQIDPRIARHFSQDEIDMNVIRENEQREAKIAEYENERLVRRYREEHLRRLAEMRDSESGWKYDDKLTAYENNVDAAHYYDYGNCLWDSPNAKNSPDMQDQDYTREQLKEWKKIHSFCGIMPTAETERRMRKMQSDARIKPQDFKRYVTELENDFHLRHSKYTPHNRSDDFEFYLDPDLPLPRRFRE